MLVADSSKLSRSAPVRIAHISQINTFVTDRLVSASLRTICQNRGIRVIEAIPDGDLDAEGLPPSGT
jgi:DeoR family glycerol-3-phosphate regulon repressor